MSLGVVHEARRNVTIKHARWISRSTNASAARADVKSSAPDAFDFASSKRLLDPPHMFFYRAFLSLLRYAERRAASRRHQRERPEARAA